MEFYLTQIMLWGINWVPDGWMICAGQSLSVNQYQALYSLIGNTYGGNSVNFNLPDLRGRAPICYGKGAVLNNNYQFGKQYGTETNSILISNLPAHAHSGNITNLTGVGGLQASTDSAIYSAPTQQNVLAAVTSDAADGGGGPATINMYADPNNLITMDYGMTLNVTGGGSFVTGNTGGNIPISNIPPVLAMTWAMCVSGGLYPPRP